MRLFAEVAEQYADFAGYARGDSPCFEAWAEGVAADAEVRAWVGSLPGTKQQPNLVFAAARWHGVPAPGPYAGLRAALLGDDGAIRATILGRTTQTNEVGRLGDAGAGPGRAVAPRRGAADLHRHRRGAPAAPAARGGVAGRDRPEPPRRARRRRRALADHARVARARRPAPSTPGGDRGRPGGPAPAGRR